MSTWELVIEFVNSHDAFMRKDAKSINYVKGSYATTSQYILLLMNAGFIRRISRGSYIRLFKVPKNLSTFKIQELAYYPELREKFMKQWKRKCKLDQLSECEK